MKYLLWYYHSIWFVLTVIILVILLGIYLYRLAAKRLIFGIEYGREFSSRGVYAGERVTLTETIYNSTSLPLLLVDVDGYITSNLKLTEYSHDERETMQYFLSGFKIIMPHMKIKRHHDIKCMKRGEYKIESVDVFLAGSQRHIISPAVLFVYPEPIAAPASFPPGSKVLGDERTLLPLISDPFSRSGFREYMPGDPMNMINFKASAATGGFMNGRLLVNKYDWCSGRTVMIYLNLRQSVYYDSLGKEKSMYDSGKKAMSGVEFENMVEYALSQSCKLLISAVRGGFRAGFATNCDCENSRRYIKFQPSTGEHFLEGILRFIASLKINAGASFPKMLADDIRAGMTGTEVYIFTAYGDAETEKNIRLLRQAGNSVKVIRMEPGTEADNEKIRKEENKA